MDIFSNVTESDHALVLIRAGLSEARAIPALDAGELAALAARAEAGVFNLLAVGEFKRGKSSLLNALLGADILPVGVIPLTAIATILSYGESPLVEVHFEQGDIRPIALSELADYVTETGNPRNTKGVREVHIRWPSPWLAQGVRLIDTPGIGSIHRHNSAVTYRYLERADAVLFLLSADQPVGQAETEFLQGVRAQAGRLFFLLNKCDLLDERERAESLAFTERALAAAVGRTVPVFAVSARWALEAGRHGDPARLAASGFPAFTAALARFLDTGKDQALARALAKALGRRIAQARLETELARAALHTPVAQLREKIAAFESRRGTLEQDRHDVLILLQAEVGQLAGETLTSAVSAFAADLTQNLARDLDRRFAELRHLPLRTLDAELQDWVVARVRASWDDFRREQDRHLDDAFQTLCARFAARIETTIDELYRFSAELFALPYARPATASVWSQESRFYYYFTSELPMLAQLTAAFWLSLPKLLGEPWVRRRAQEQMRMLVDRQAGRVRHDFVERLAQSRQAFTSALLQRLDNALAGIDSAMRRGLALSLEGEQAAARRATELAADLDRLDRLAGRLQPLLEGSAES